MEAMKKAPRLTNEDKGKETRLAIEEYKGKETLDVDLWGKLQEHISLQAIYKKLSQWDLFQLRLVSKEWNHAALQWILPKLSFVFILAGIDSCDFEVQFLNGIVTYNNVCGKVKFNHQRLCLLYAKSHVPPFEVERLILCNNPGDLEQRGVFNVHTQTWHAIPFGPKQSETLSTCGLLVNTSVKPYTFKLIEGNCTFRTQIYDSKSRSWSRTSSISPPLITEDLWTTPLEYSCICHNDTIYIFGGTDLILKYCLEDDKWTSLKSPKLKIDDNNPPLDNTLGVWASRIFTTRVSYKKRRITVWEHVYSKGQEWAEYAHMSKEHYGWLLKPIMDGGDSFNEAVIFRSFFRDGYLLVCSWFWDSAYVNGLVLFDMATKIWLKVDLSRRIVAADKHDVESSLTQMKMTMTILMKMTKLMKSQLFGLTPIRLFGTWDTM